VILILLTVALRASRQPARPWPSHVLGTFGFSVLIPLTALIIGTGVLGAEIDDGSIVHLLATPVRRSSVIATKFLVATGLTMLFAAVPELIAALIAGGGSIPDAASKVPGPAGFTAISTSKFALLSVSHYGLGIANGFVNDSELQAGLGVAASVIMGVIVTALALAVNLLSSFTLKGEPA
jgi:ABC-2 type transport system permease protein